MASGPANRTLDACLRLSLLEDRTKAVLHIDPGAPLDELSVESIMAFLASKALSLSRVDADAVATLVSAALETTDETHEALVASGKPAEHGEDGDLIWDEDLRAQLDRLEARAKALRRRRRFEDGDEQPAATSGEGADDEGEDDAVDFYNQSAFLIVNAGDPIGRLTKPTPGSDGLDVVGETIPAKPGKSADLTTDGSIKTDRNDHLIAKLSGRLIHEPSKLKIDPVLRIDGQIDFSTGNVDFPGDVSIGKGVRDRFRVRAKGSVTIGELAEACTIETDGSLVLNNGMAGRDQGRIEINEDLDARYLDAVTGFIEGECRVQREITNCELAVGRFESPACVVRGGVLSAAKGIDLNTVGSESGSRTEIRLGHIPKLDHLVRQAADAVPDMQARVAAAAKRLEYLHGLPRQTEKEMEEQITLDMQRQQLEERLGEVTTVMERALGMLAERCMPWIRVRRAIHAQSVIELPGYVVRFDRDAKGPIEIEPGEDGVPLYRSGPDDAAKPLSAIASVSPSTTVTRPATVREELGMAA